MTTLTAMAEAAQAIYAERRREYTDHVRTVIRDRAAYEVVWWRIIVGVDVTVRDEGKG